MSDIEMKARDMRETGDLHRNPQDQPGTERNAVALASPANFSLRVLRAEAESNAITHALRQTGGNRKRAAQLLRISYRGLLYKMQRFNIVPDALPGCRVVPVPAKPAKIDDFSGV
jgi:DNA-binding NtrC family response regulator